MTSMKLLNLLLTSILVSLLVQSCEKGPYSTSAEGFVINSVDSSKVASASVFVIHWDGNKKSDTTKIFETKCDSLGFFSLKFEAEKKHGLYWAKAEKDGFTSSSLELIDAGSTNGCKIKLYP